MDYVKYTEATIYEEYSIKKLPWDLARGDKERYPLPLFWEFDWQMAYSPNVSLVDKIMEGVVDNLKKDGGLQAHLIPGGKIFVYL